MTCLWTQHIWVIAFRVANLSDQIALKEHSKWAQQLTKQCASPFIQTYSAVKRAAFDAICQIYIAED